MIETSRRSFLGGLLGLIAAPSIVTAAGVRPGLWTPPKITPIWAGGAWSGRIDLLGHLVSWKPEGADDWLPIDTHPEGEHWKRLLFPSGYRGTEQLLMPPRLVHKWARHDDQA